MEGDRGIAEREGVEDECGTTGGGEEDRAGEAVPGRGELQRDPGQDGEGRQYAEPAEKEGRRPSQRLEGHAQEKGSPRVVEAGGHEPTAIRGHRIGRERLPERSRTKVVGADLGEQAVLEGLKSRVPLPAHVVAHTVGRHREVPVRGKAGGDGEVVEGTPVFEHVLHAGAAQPERGVGQEERAQRRRHQERLGLVTEDHGWKVRP
jgi:hypothetical protein